MRNLLFARIIAICSIHVFLISCTTNLDINDHQEVQNYLYSHSFTYEDHDADLISIMLFNKEESSQVVLSGTSIISAAAYDVVLVHGLEKEKRTLLISGANGEWHIEANGWLWNWYKGDWFIFKPKELPTSTPNNNQTAQEESQNEPINPKIHTDHGTLFNYKTMDEYYFDSNGNKVWHGYRKNIYPNGNIRMLAFYEHGEFIWSEQYNEVGIIQERKGIRNSSESVKIKNQRNNNQLAEEYNSQLESARKGYNDTEKAFLTIEGSNIWVRRSPSIGEVVMKLNDGDKCSIIEKGKSELIRDVFDYWYKIEFEGKIGWIFGSQTTVRTNLSKYQAEQRGFIKLKKNSKDEFKKFLKEFLDTTFSYKNFDSLVYKESPLITEYTSTELGLGRFWNQGVYCGQYSSPKYGYVFYDEYFGETYPDLSNLQFFAQKTPEKGFCEESISIDGVYYSSVKELPTDIIFDSDGFTSYKSQDPKYSALEKIKVEILYGKYIIKTLYFVKNEDDWKLLYIYDCDCSA